MKRIDIDLPVALKGRRLLVTGGAGFVGSRIVHRLVELGSEVRVLDDLATGTRESIEDLPRVEVVIGSVDDFETVREATRGVEIVIHAAARNIIVSTRNPRLDFQTNIGGTLNVLLSAREEDVQRVVYTSSASVYGNPRYLPVTEDEQPSLLSPYAVSKFAGESYCQAFYESYGVPTAVVRYSNVYGHGQSPANPYCGVIAKFFQAAREGKPIVIHGDGLQTRDFTYIDDTVEATLLAAVSPRAVGDVFNVGTGFETSVNTLAQMVVEVVGAGGEIQHVDRRDIDNIRRRVLNIERIRRVLHWVPRFTLRNGLTATARWLKDG